MKYKLNLRLIKEIPKLHHKTKDAFYLYAKYDGSTWRRNVKDDMDFPVLKFIRMCNKCRIPIRPLLIMEGETGDEFIREDLKVKASDYVPIMFDIEAFRNAWGIKGEANERKDVMIKELGYSTTSLGNWCEIDETKNKDKEKKSTLWFSQLFEFCDKFNRNIEDFIHPAGEGDVNLDDTLSLVEVRSKKEWKEKYESLFKLYDSVLTENWKLSEENKTLRDKIINMTGELMEKSKENETLKQTLKARSVKTYPLVEPTGVFLSETDSPEYGKEE